MSTTASACSSEENKAAEKADLSNVPLDDVSPGPSTTSSSLAEHHRQRSSATDKEQALSRDDSEAADQLTGLQNKFSIIIKEFFGCLTKEQRLYISNGVYYSDVREKLIDMGMEVMSVFIEAVTDNLSKTMYQPHQRPTSPQEHGTEEQQPPSKVLRETFGITEDNIQNSLKDSFGKAFCDVARADTSVSVAHSFTGAILKTITDEVNCVLSDTINVSLERESSNVCATCCQFSSCTACKEIMAEVIQRLKSIFKAFGTLAVRQQSDRESNSSILTGASTINVQKKKSWWRSFFPKWRKNKTKVRPISDEEVHMESSTSKLSSGCSSPPCATSDTCSAPSSKLRTSLELLDVEEEDATSEEIEDTQPSVLISLYPSIYLENTINVPDYQECPPLFENQTNVRSSSCHRCSDSDNRITAITDTQAGRRRTKRPSLLKRIQTFFCSLCCCSKKNLGEE